MRRRIDYGLNWAKEFSLEETTPEISSKEKAALLSLLPKLEQLSDPLEIQAAIFDAARENGLEQSEFFRVLYRILLGVDRGPRLGPYIKDVGSSKILRKA